MKKKINNEALWIRTSKLNVLNNFGRGHHEEHFCDRIFNSGLGENVVNSHFSLGALVTLRSVKQNNLCNFGRGHFRDKSVKIFEFGPAVQEVEPATI